MTFDPTTNCVVFGLLCEEDQEALRNWPHGLLYFDKYGSWLSKYSTHLVLSTTYRGKPAPLVPDSINWDHVAPEYICMARDKDGRALLHSVRVKVDECIWRGVECFAYATDAEAFASYRQGTFPWEQSLVYRPGYEPKGEKK
jgi:hypothetical protein